MRILLVLLAAGCDTSSPSAPDLATPDLARSEDLAGADLTMAPAEDLATSQDAATSDLASSGPALPVGFTSTRALNGSNASNPASNVWVVSTSGTGATPLTSLTYGGAGGIYDPAWSPDGKKIAFESDRALDNSNTQNTNATFNIWVMNADGSGATPLTRITAQNAGPSNPVWSPDGQKIAYHSGRALNGSDALNGVGAGTQNVWVMDANGSNGTPLTSLTTATAHSILPVWSPDGSQIAYRSRRALDSSDAKLTGSGANVWITTPDGLTQRHLTAYETASVTAGNSAFSPDGSKIAFDSAGSLDGNDTIGANGDSNIWVVAVSPSPSPAPLTRYTAAQAGAAQPTWSPNGSQIAFRGLGALNGSDAPSSNSTTNVWLMNASGSSAAPLTQLSGGAIALGRVAWSADGSALVYASTRAVSGSDAINTNNVTNIWLVKADASAGLPLTQLTASGVEDITPVFHN